MIRVCESRCPKCGQSVREDRSHFRCERCGLVEASMQGLVNAIDDTKAREAVESFQLATNS